MLPAMLIRAANEAGGLDNIAVAVAARPPEGDSPRKVGTPQPVTPAVRKQSGAADRRPDEPRSGHSLLVVGGIAGLLFAAALVGVIALAS